MNGHTCYKQTVFDNDVNDVEKVHEFMMNVDEDAIHEMGVEDGYYKHTGVKPYNRFKFINCPACLKIYDDAYNGVR